MVRSEKDLGRLNPKCSSDTSVAFREARVVLRRVGNRRERDGIEHVVEWRPGLELSWFPFIQYSIWTMLSILAIDRRMWFRIR
jgi:hypothetical protein